MSSLLPIISAQGLAVASEILKFAGTGPLPVVATYGIGNKFGKIFRPSEFDQQISKDKLAYEGVIDRRIHVGTQLQPHRIDQASRYVPFELEPRACLAQVVTSYHDLEPGARLLPR